MSLFHAIATLITLAAVFAWLNHKVIRLPHTIGLMVISLLTSLALVGLGRANIVDTSAFTQFVRSVDFDAALLHGMLGALLFAGGLHVDLDRMLVQKGIILLLATVGTLLSTALIGVGSWWLFGVLGFPLPLVWALLLGALISPTDPIAVGAILRKVGVPEALEAMITGESLFNDGVGVVLFVIIEELARGGGHVEAGHAATLFLQEAGGGLLFGALSGWGLYLMLRTVDNYQVEILLTLAYVTGGYALANALHVSGPLAMVVGGILIGNRGRRFAMSEQTRIHLDNFWELVDEFLNAGLFVLIGLEIIVLELTGPVVVAGSLLVVLVLAARYVSVGLPLLLVRRFLPAPRHAVTLLTWSGLRGGISVALALSLPLGGERDLLVTTSYIVVCFSIIVQGLTVGPVTRRLVAKQG